MSLVESTRALRAAVAAARAAGALMRRHVRSVKQINAATDHDLKLELDVRCQRLIERRLRAAFPETAFLGEEGSTGAAGAATRWVVDPIDGTVNYAYGIPHACVSIAWQRCRQAARGNASAVYDTHAGVVFDPFCDELWSAVRGRPARLNGRVVRVSTRKRLGEAVVALGSGKRAVALAHMVHTFAALVERVRKVRITGSAALALTYVASGRFDAYAEAGLQWWDIAAGGLILECAGGRFEHREMRGGGHDLCAHNGWIGKPLRRYLAPLPE